MNTHHSKGSSRMRITFRQITPLILSVLLPVALSGCKTDTKETTFEPAAGDYESAQTVKVTLPPRATKVYLTTDSVEPVANEACAYAGQDLIIDRHTIVKLRYEIDGQPYNYDLTYKVNEVRVDNGFTNRIVIDAWENFFVKQVLRQLELPEYADADALLEDGAGGTVNVAQRVYKTPITQIVDSGTQTYRFNYFEKSDSDTAEVIMIRSGEIYGSRNRNGGHYRTQVPLVFSGTYNGWAEGSFFMNQEGATTGGIYRVYCEDLGCAPNPVTYHLNANNGLIEVDQTRHANSISCIVPEMEE